MYNQVRPIPVLHTKIPIEEISWLGVYSSPNSYNACAEWTPYCLTTYFSNWLGWKATWWQLSLLKRVISITTELAFVLFRYCIEWFSVREIKKEFWSSENIQDPILPNFQHCPKIREQIFRYLEEAFVTASPVIGSFGMDALYWKVG